MVERDPHSKLTRKFCVPCTEQYLAKKEEQELCVELGTVEQSMQTTQTTQTQAEPHESEYAKSEKKRLFEMFYSLTYGQIVDIVYNMLDQKEQFIQKTLNENDLLRFEIENFS
jgi:hypothetical protein